MSGFKPFDPNAVGGGQLPTFTPPESPFANDAARDVWAAANLDLLYNGDSVFSFTLVESDSIAQRWSGENEPAVYDNSFWIIIGAGGGSLDQEQLIYVSKTGNDSSSGLNIDNPKLTISGAIVSASALTPAEGNQITIEVIDTGTYTESPTLPEWVHIDAANAALSGRLTVEDNTIASFRRLQNSNVTQPVVRKASGTGFAKLAVELLIVSGSSQEGLLVDAGVMHIDAGVMSIDAGTGIKAKNGSRVSFIVSEVQLLNGGLGIGTRTAGGGANFFSGNVLYAKDDGTGVLLEAKVVGDTINIQAGSLIVDTLYDMGASTTLDIFVTEAVGSVITDPTATINSTLAGDDLSKTKLVAQTVAGPVEFLQSITVPTGSVILGKDGARIGSSTRALSFIDARERNTLFAQYYYDDTGGTLLEYWDIDVRQTFNVCPDSGVTLPDPQELAFSGSIGNTLTRAFRVIPKAAGELRVQSWEGSDDTGAVIGDNMFTILIGDVDTITTLELPAGQISEIGDMQFVRFSGVQLSGSLSQSGGIFIGQECPFLDSDIHLLTKKFPGLFGSEYQFVSDETVSSTTSMTFETKLTMVTPSVPAGNYRGETTCAVTNDSSNKTVTIGVFLDGNLFNESSFSPKTGGEFIVKTVFQNTSVLAGVHTIELKYKAGATGGTVSIKNARMEIFRVS